MMDLMRTQVTTRPHGAAGPPGAAADAGAGVLGFAPNSPPPSKPPAGAAGVADAFAVELAGAAAVGAEPNNPPEGATAGAIWRNVSE